MQQRLPRRDVVLLGAGHTNAHIVRMWKMEPWQDVRLTCISNMPIASYSGMLPAVLANQYDVERMHIDLVRLCASAGVGLIVDDVSGIDVNARRLHFATSRPPLPFDALSIGVGSVPIAVPAATSAAEHELVLRIKPMQTFLRRLDRRLNMLQSQVSGRPLQLDVVGGGVAGVEVTLCLLARLKRLFANQPFELTLIDGGSNVPRGTAARTQQLAEHVLRKQNVRLLLGRYVVSVNANSLRLDDGLEVSSDLVLWATAATAPRLLKRLEGLDKDDQGFLLTRDTLQVISGQPIFAVGDSGTIAGQNLPKAGVYAVRQGPVLWTNLKRAISDDTRPLQRYRPQTDFLKLLNTGDGRAIAEYKGFSAHARWARWLKDWIDGRFMDKYQDYRPMSMKSDASPQIARTMRCAGCGSKVGGSVLQHVFERLQVPQSDDVLLGLATPDDAAIVRSRGQQPFTVTVDFFSAPLDDPYLVGRIAALNAASDLFAMGTCPAAALAMAMLPVGSERQQEELLFQLLRGSLEELTRMGATLVGGHTTEGSQTMIGFTMLANQQSIAPTEKQNLETGDTLVLTKPLGSGALLAAHMRARCASSWWKKLLETMLISNQAPAERALKLGVQSITDVTGFGLAGHLLEMLRASRRSCQLRLSDIPVLPGAEQVVEEGIESTLAPANRNVEPAIGANESTRQSARYRLLFDPQTSGGLLIAVDAGHRDELLMGLGDGAWEIGTVVDCPDGTPRIEIQS